jgi:hypothetical protein
MSKKISKSKEDASSKLIRSTTSGVLRLEDFIPITKQSTQKEFAITLPSKYGRKHMSRVTLKKSDTPKKNATTRKALQYFGKTMKQPKILAELLTQLCSDAGSCLTFGRFVKPTKKLFGDFVDLTRAYPLMRRIGNPSANGFVYELTYENHGFRAHTILKCGLQSDLPYTNIDNLYYEFLVGKLYINDCSMRFPCFLETYNAYDLDKNIQKSMANTKTFAVKDLIPEIKSIPHGKDVATNYAQNLKFSCENQYNIAILIQHIASADSMDDYFLRENDLMDYWYGELPHLLYQIYGPLAQLGNKFTHFDLHTDNVLLYNIGNEKYIQMNYIFPTETVSFKTHLICKMIDYGRSYFYVNNTTNSTEILKKVCEQCIDKTDPSNKCGNENGYNWLQMEDGGELKDQYYIMGSQPNISHDLRLMNDIKISPDTPNMLKKMSSGIKDIFRDLVYEDKYGTPAHSSAPFSAFSSSSTKKIYNIYDAADRLRKILLHSSEFRNVNDKQYKNNVCIGTMNVYMDSSNKSMGFELPK